MFTKKCFTFLFLSFVSLSSAYPKEEDIVDCVVSSGIERNDLKNLDWANMEKFPEKTKCFLKCIIEKEGVFDANGEVKVDHIENNLEAYQIQPKHKDDFVKCIQGAGHVIKTCEDTVHLLQCYVKYSDKAKSK